MRLDLFSVYILPSIGEQWELAGSCEYAAHRGRQGETKLGEVSDVTVCEYMNGLYVQHQLKIHLTFSSQ